MFQLNRALTKWINCMGWVGEPGWSREEPERHGPHLGEIPSHVPQDAPSLHLAEQQEFQIVRTVG